MNHDEWNKFLEMIRNPTKLVSREEILSVGVQHPLNFRTVPSASISVVLPYVFKCNWCADIDLSCVLGGFYNIIADTLGGPLFLVQRTGEEDILKGPVDDILTVRELGFEPEHSSSINPVKRHGYLCDHCFECYQDDRRNKRR